MNVFSTKSLANCYKKHGSCHCILVFYKNNSFFPTILILIWIFEIFHLLVPWNEGIQHNEYKAGQLKLKSTFKSDPDFHADFGWVQLHPDWNWECFPSWIWVCILTTWWEETGWALSHEVSQAGNSVTPERNNVMQCKCSLKQSVLDKNLAKF